MGLFGSSKSSSESYQYDEQAQVAGDNSWAASNIEGLHIEQLSDDVAEQALKTGENVLLQGIEFANNTLVTGAQQAEKQYNELLENLENSQQDFLGAFQNAQAGMESAFTVTSEALKGQLTESQAGAMNYIIPIILAVVLPVGFFWWLISGKK